MHWTNFVPRHRTIVIVMPTTLHLRIDFTSKLFIGGLNWDTTDGILPSQIPIYVPLIIIFCPSSMFPPYRRPKELLQRVREGIATCYLVTLCLLIQLKGRRMHNYARRSWNIKRLCFSNLRRCSFCQRSRSPRALFGRKGGGCISSFVRLLLTSTSTDRPQTSHSTRGTHKEYSLLRRRPVPDHNVGYDAKLFQRVREDC